MTETEEVPITTLPIGAPGPVKRTLKGTISQTLLYLNLKIFNIYNLCSILCVKLKLYRFPLDPKCCVLVYQIVSSVH